MAGLVRWRKLWADMGAIRGRLLLVLLALTTGLLATISISSAYVILTREVSANYINTNPASGILDIGDVDQALLDRVRKADGIDVAEPLTILTTRIRHENGGWDRALVFVSPDPLNQEISQLPIEAGTAMQGAVLLERRALDLIDGEIGQNIALEIPGVGLVTAPVSGTVFDPALAPADQEQAVYIYIDQATFTALGGAANFEMIRVVLEGDRSDQAQSDAVISRVANELRADGINVHLVQIPPAGQHPHEGSMKGMIALFLVFGILAFLLSSVLVSVTIEGLMSSQSKQIAVMKTIGATARTIMILYVSGMLVLGAVTLLISVPIGVIAGRGLADVIAQLLNLNITSDSISPLLIVGWILSGLLVPAGFAFLPVRRAARATIVAALSDPGLARPANHHPVASSFFAFFGGSSQIQLALRGVFRRRRSTLLIVFLMALAGAMFLTARTTGISFQTSVDVAARERLHDVDLTLIDAVSSDVLNEIAQADPRIVSAQILMSAEAALARPDGLSIVRTYPDGGHGSMTLIAGENLQNLQQHNVLQGALSDQNMDGQLVVNQSALHLLGNPSIGDTVRLAIDGPVLELTLRAVIRQYLTPATVYVGRASFMATTGEKGSNRVRLVINPSDQHTVTDVVQNFGARSQSRQVYVKQAMAEFQMADAIRGHVDILVALLFALGIMMAAVGFLGLTAAQGISVSERSREFGIMRAIGGLRRQILGTIFIEGLIIGMISLPLAVLLSLPISLLMTSIIGMISFGFPLPYAVDFDGILLWSLITLIGSQLASIAPALDASRQSVRETLIQI
ncbi:FtsX-like permease family protein [Planktotalea arctica]|uniref:FtsX-like permease family protein n=1 Tax=Planktotalea arctica TaxID=1481893 RepID=UPI00321BCD6C